MHVAVWSPKVHAVFFAAALRSRLLLRRGREESTGTSKPNVVETNVSQSAGSKASLALVGRTVPSQESGFQNRSRALGLSAVCVFYYCRTYYKAVPVGVLLQSVHLNAKG